MLTPSRFAYTAISHGTTAVVIDPHEIANVLNIDGINLESYKLTESKLKYFDCVAITTDHSSYDYKMISENAQLIVDTRNAIKGELYNKNVIKI